jgi:hypothetical protein
VRLRARGAVDVDRSTTEAARPAGVDLRGSSRSALDWAARVQLLAKSNTGPSLSRRQGATSVLQRHPGGSVTNVYDGSEGTEIAAIAHPA